MKERMIELTCPHCGHVFFLRRHSLVNANIDNREIEGFFLHCCSHCQQSFGFAYPFVYFVPGQIALSLCVESLMVDCDWLNFETVPAFLVAVKCAKAGLNVRQVLGILDRFPDHRFVDGDKQMLWLEKDGLIKAVVYNKE